MNPSLHIQHIEASIHELGSLQDRTKAPASLQHQYIGTIIDNTVCLLCSPANSLDGGGRNITFSEIGNWVSAMQAVHRSFYSSIHSATELALEEYCKENNINVESNIRLEHRKKYSKLKLTIPTEIEPKISDFVNDMLKGLRPGFYDYLNSVLEHSDFNKDKKKKWRAFFDGLSIIRNKVSHSNPSLNLNEIERLRTGGFGSLVSDKYEIQVNTRNYFPITQAILNFFDELLH